MRQNLRDLTGGLIVALLSLAFLIGSFRYDLGITRRMGPGYFPMVVSSVGVLLGLGIVGSAMKFPGEMPRIAWRPTLSVTAGIIVFGLTVPLLGLLPATFLLVAISAIGNPENRIATVLILGLAAAVLAWLIFIVGLSLPIPVLPRGL